MRNDWYLFLLISQITTLSVLSACPSLTGGIEGYNISALNLEFKTIYNSTLSFHLNICGNAPSCRGNSGCYTSLSDPGGDPVLLGDVTSAETQVDHLHVILESGALATHITILCGNSLGRPEVQYKNDTHTIMIWESRAGCRNIATQHQVPCYTYNEQRQLIDLNDLVGSVHHIPIGDSETNPSTIYFSVCGPVTGEHACEGGASCILMNGNNNNIGTVTRGPSVSDGGVVLSYQASATSPTCPTITTTLVLVCTPHQQTPATLIYTTDSCSYNLVWRSEHACPVVPVHDVGCKVQARGLAYDLTPLMGRDYTTRFGEHVYTVSVCGSIATGCKGEAAAGCMADTGSDKAWSMGSYHEGNLVWDDEGLTLIYNGGSQCSSGQVRSTKILFVCDKTVDKGAPEMTEQFYCFYSFIWRTRYACPEAQVDMCAKYGTDGELYDLTMLGHRGWAPVPGSDVTTDHAYLLSVCGGVPECRGSSFCRRVNSTSYEALASLSEHFVVKEDKSLELTFEGQGTCQAKPTSLTVELTCKQGSVEYPPVLLSEDPCNYSVLWETGEACPAHSVRGEGCRLKDGVTGLTYDLTGLAEKAYTVPTSDNSSTISIQICGSLTDISVCGAGVSVCRSDGVVLGYTSVGDKDSSKLIYENRQLAIGLSGADCGTGGARYTTVIEFMCGNTSEVSSYSMGSCGYYVMWSDPAACPMFPVECAVNNGTHSFNLSPLYEAGNLEWSGLVGDTQTAIYLRPCGQVTSGTEGCSHTAGVCGVREKAGEKVSLSLGRASSDLIIEGGVVTEVYENGDRVCSDTSLRAHTRVEYSCVRDQQSEILSTLFNDELCMYIVAVASPYGCIEEHVTSHNCNITDPTTGLTYDFSALSSDQEFSNAASLYSFHLCGPLSKPCGDKEAGACEVVNGNYLSLGDSASSTLSFSDSQFTLTYTGGAECAGSTRDGVRYKSTEITLVCNRDVAVGTPRYVNQDSESCVYHFEWEVAAACPPLQPQCRVIDDKLREYDLSVLRRDTPWTVTSSDGANYHLNVCGECPDCGSDSAICSTIGGKTVSLGRASAEPEVREDYSVSLRYYHGDTCDGSRKWTTQILFFCQQGAESLPTIRLDTESCLASVEWRTLHACPAAFAKGANCSVADPVTGVTYDLWKLAGREFSGVLKEHTYTYSFCTPLQSPCNGVPTAGSCQISTGVSTEEKNNGVINTNLTYSNGVIIIKYTNGDVCSRGDIRETTINLVCDHSLSDVEVEMDQINEVSHCVYESFAFSGLPCDKEALSQCEAAGYDITGLSLTRDNYYTQSGVTTFTINVCRGINSPAPCGTNTAICMRRDLGRGISVGEVSSAELVYEDSNLKLRYTGQDICPSSGEPYRAIITFFCDASGNVGTPEYLSNNTCTFYFLWTSTQACKGQDVAQSCKVTNTLTGETVLDLTSLRGTFSVPGATSDVYSVAVCDKLTTTQCKSDSAVCLLTDNTSKYMSMGLFEHDTSITRSGSTTTAILTYLNGDICQKGDGSSVPYQTDVEFVCDKQADDRDVTPAFISKEDCLLRFQIRTSLVCPTEQLSCEVEVNGHIFDLSPLREIKQYMVSDKVDIPGVMYLSVCQSLPDGVYSDCGVTGAAACFKPTGAKLAMNLGRLGGPLEVADDGTVTLEYPNGEECDTIAGGFFSTLISFKCDTNALNIPYLTSVDHAQCRYDVTWTTPLLCADPDPEPTDSCLVTDPLTGYVYDMTLVDTQFSKITSEGTYSLKVCGVAESCGGQDVVACFNPGEDQTPLGRLKSVSGTFKNGIIEMTYHDDPTTKCKDGIVSDVFVSCCTDEDLQVISSTECRYEFAVCSRHVCQFNPKECIFRVGKDIFDFSAISRSHDNWVIDDKDRKFFINPCRGVNTDSTMTGCVENSISCLSEQSVAGSKSLGLIESRVQVAGSQEGQMKVSYEGGSDSVCMDRTAKTEIMFTCGTSLGTPKLFDTKDCVYRFTWESYVACPSSSRPVTSDQCTYSTPTSATRIDLRRTERAYFSVTTATGRYLDVHFAACDGTLDNRQLEEGRCYGAAVCIKDNGKNTVLKLDVKKKEVFAREDGAEVILGSSVKCHDSEDKNWETIIQYNCNSETRNETASFITMSHCHVILAVDTPVVCSGYKPKSHHVSFLVAILILLGVVFLGLTLVYICINPNRRHKLLRKLRSVVPVRGDRSEPMTYKRLRMGPGDDLLSDSDEDIVGL